MKPLIAKKILLGVALLFMCPFYVYATKDMLPQAVIDMYEAHTIGDMGYRLLRPINFDPDIRYPVVITLHNGQAKSEVGAKDYNVKNLRFINGQFTEESIRLAYPAYILCPQAKTPFGKQELALCKEIIASLPSVEMRRIYVMGQSMGGTGAIKFIVADPTYFAAAIIVSAEADIVKAPNILKDFDLWALHGSDDPVSPYENGLAFFEAVKKVGGRMKFTTFIKEKNNTERFMIGDFPITSTPLPSGTLKNGHTTQASGPGFDPESNTLKWLFSKRRN